MFDRLEDFTVYHFMYEDRLIEKSGYPNGITHIREHAATIDTLKRFKTLINTPPLTREFLLSIKRQLIRLLVNHVKNCDVRLCRHLLELKEVGGPASDLSAADKMPKRIGEILVDSNIISVATLELALEKQMEIGVRLGKVLIGMGAVKAEDVVEAYAIQIGLLRGVEV